MSDSQQALLRSAWLDAKDGSLSGREQAKAWAMREIWKGDGKPKHGMLMYIAAKLKKKGGGSPSCPALHQLFAKVDADDDWFPGKANYDDVGRLPVMTRQQRAALARTMVYSYTYTLCRRGVVASFDLSARNLHLFKTDHWLKDPRNVIQLHLTSPAWQTGVAASSQMMSRTEQMRSWTVAETGRFLEEHDLEGPAELTRVSGVNGADLLQLSINELSHDIRLTPFAARKVGAARDEFLRGL